MPIKYFCLNTGFDNVWIKPGITLYFNVCLLCCAYTCVPSVNSIISLSQHIIHECYLRIATPVRPATAVIISIYNN